MRLLPLVALLLVAACGQQVDVAADDPVTPTVATTTPAAAGSASSSPSSSATSAPASALPHGLRGVLLTAAELPLMNGVSSWRVARTGREADPIGACQVTGLQTIGAMSAWVRTFDGGAKGSAIQVVAEFADAKSAWRAHEVLKSWRSKCAARVGGGATVTALGSVPVSPSVGHRYVVDTRHQVFEGVGIIRNDDLVSLVVYVAHGSSYSYPAGREPETRALKAIAPLL